METTNEKGTDPNRDGTGKFVKGNKAAEEWTEETVLPILQQMWHTLTTDENGEIPDDKNIIRSNDIKLLGEICLMYDVTKQRWNEWEDKFQVTEDNSYSSKPVTDLIKKIRWILECRLNYSGQTMDIFILKAHYKDEGYRFAEQVDVTSKDKEIGSSFIDFLKLTSQGVKKNITDGTDSI